MKSKLKSLICTSLALLMLAQNTEFVSAASYTPNTTGRWMTGEYHTHTVQSSDASESFMTLENVLNGAFREDLGLMPSETVTSLTYGDPFDFLVLTDHLRNSPRDPEGNDKKTARWEAIKDQQEKLTALQAAGKYTGKIIYPGFEWDMMGLDHGSVGIIDSNSDEVPIDAIHQFEWLYSYDTSAEMFTSNEAERWGKRPTKDELKPNKEKAYEAIEWLKHNYPESFVLPNHPSRHNGDSSGVVTIGDLRKMNDIAPDIVFGMEGMPGNHMAASKNRSELADIYGGADVMIAQVGGVWDALLGEGRRFWNFTNSDFHFKVSSNRKYSSGYWPSEYSRNYTWVEGDTFRDVVEGMRSGKSFAVYGDLINALDFKAIGNGHQAEMGGNLQVSEGDLTTISIRFKSPEKNNYAPISDHETTVTNDVYVDHIDLISGEVTGKLDISQYASNTTNDTTKVIKRFTKQDWGQPDAEGYYTVSYTVPADTSRYYRLRGTNLGTDVEGFTVNGEPLKDESFDYDREQTPEQNEERFNNINDRNYTGLWFYSNPIFVDVISDEQAINDTSASVTEALGDTSSITSNMTLPTEGLYGSTITWSSSNEHIIRIEGQYAIVTRPSASESDTSVILTATISHGQHSIDKAYTVVVKAQASNSSSNDNGTTNNPSGSNNNTAKPAISLEGTGGTQQPSTPSIAWSDIEHHWAASSIDYVTKNGLLNGTSATNFSPDSFMTRGMLVTVMHRMANMPVAASHSFKDVTANAYYSDAVAWASMKGIVKGIDAAHFAPNQSITREQLAQLLYNYARMMNLDMNTSSVLSSFTDVKSISAWAMDAMSWSVSHNLLSGRGNNMLDPAGTVTRAEAAAFVECFMNTFNF